MKASPSATAPLGALTMALALVAGAAVAQPPTLGHAKILAIQAAAPKAGGKLTVTSPSFKDGADIPYENTQYRGNIFPGLNWSKGPAGTKSYVVVMQGTLGGAESGNSIHFTLFNIPAGVTKLDVGLKTPPAGAIYGPNVHGMNTDYAGPHTHGPEKHDYHLQVLALDTVLPADKAMTYEAMVAGMEGHVLASGEVTGLANMDPTSKEAAELAAKAKQGGKAKPE
jgi:para-nitrobenzyl esterase